MYEQSRFYTINLKCAILLNWPAKRIVSLSGREKETALHEAA